MLNKTAALEGMCEEFNRTYGLKKPQKTIDLLATYYRIRTMKKHTQEKVNNYPFIIKYGNVHET